MEILAESWAGILASKCGPYLERGQLHQWRFLVLDKIDLSQGWGIPNVQWCAHQSARFEEVVAFIPQ
eukprot:270735-Heterocapsa_arctica.AAC.1